MTLHIYFCYIIYLFMCISAISCASGETSDQRSATYAFLREFAREFPQLRQIWSGTDYCSWSWVECNSITNKVRVDLSYRQLNGQMPEIPDHVDGKDVLVTYMNLSHNSNLYDEFEDDWGELSQLKILDLSYTSLRGEIPNDWEDMKSLEEVYISHTKACKRLPHWHLRLLRVIDLSYNNMGGRLSSAWADMSNLQKVNLEGNHFCGCVPDAWEHNSLLMSAVRANNKSPQCKENECNKDSNRCDDRNDTSSTSTSTPTPDITPNQRSATYAFLREFAREFPQLRQIWSGTDYCSWSGVECNSITNKVRVDLSYRQLNGQMPEIPDHVDGKDVLVTYMNLSHNSNLYDEFEDDWGELSQLKILDLSYTSLRGEIPDDWDDMKSLEEVYISHTKACKRLPHWHLRLLRVIDLSYNNMGGRLSSAWADISNLQKVNLEGNHFCGCVPDAWEHNSLLMSAVRANNKSPQCKENECNKDSNRCDDRNDTSSTSTSTPTPDITPNQRSATYAFLREFAREFPQLRQIWSGTDYCSWSGVECNSITNEVRVDLSYRQLNGQMPEIPDHVDGKDVLVTYMNLSHNSNLYDEFEDDWGELSQLKILDLSYTSLRGEIPDDWDDMKSLEEVYISHTKACKRLPHWHLRLLRVIDLSYNNMGGRLSSAWADMSNLQKVNLEGNHFCGCVPDAWEHNSLLMSAVPVNNQHSNCEYNVCDDKSNYCDKAIFYNNTKAIMFIILFVSLVILLLQ